MTVTPDHLVIKHTDRGFATLPPIPGGYGGNVRVHNSSSATHHHVWLAAKSPVDANRRMEAGSDEAYTDAGGRWDEAIVHLRIEDAVKVAEQIMLLAEEG